LIRYQNAILSFSNHLLHGTILFGEMYIVVFLNLLRRKNQTVCYRENFVGRNSKI
jgi:hypothetical protein